MELYGNSMFNFLRNQLFSTVAEPFPFPPAMYKFLHIFTNTCYFQFLNNLYSSFVFDL